MVNIIISNQNYVQCIKKLEYMWTKCRYTCKRNGKWFNSYPQINVLNMMMNILRDDILDSAMKQMKYLSIYST